MTLRLVSAAARKLVRVAHTRLVTTVTGAIRLEDINIISGEGRSAGAIYSSILECAGEALRMRAAMGEGERI